MGKSMVGFRLSSIEGFVMELVMSDGDSGKSKGCVWYGPILHPQHLHWLYLDMDVQMSVYT